MTTIKKFEEKLGVKNLTFRPFEATDDENLCAWVDFIHEDKYLPIGVTIRKELPNTEELISRYNNVKLEFEEKFKGLYIILTLTNFDEQVEFISNAVLDKRIENIGGIMIELNKQQLKERGLSDEQISQFLSILDVLTPTEEDYEAFDSEMNEGIPFEGGMGFTEALTALKISLK
jgi:hypothetical protein